MVAEKPPQAGDSFLLDVQCVYQAPTGTPFAASLCVGRNASRLAPFDEVYFECGR
jgi:hypothetical protein